MRAGCSRVTHPCAGRRQQYCYRRAAPRLACVRPAASVHPEPGSNSSLYIFVYLLFLQSLLALRPLGPPGPRTDALDSSCFGTCFACFSVSLVNELDPSRVAPVPRPAPLAVPLFPNGIAKVLLFPEPPNFFALFFPFFCISPVAAPAGDDRPPGRRPYGSPRCGTETAESPPGSEMPQECDRWKQQSRHLAQKCRKSVTGGSSRVATWLRKAARV